MKTIKLKVCNILILSLLFLLCSILGACGSTGKTESSDKSDEEPVVKEEGLIADFENYEEIRKFDFGRSFGRASVNTDKKYITSGNGSMKIENTRSNATVMIPLKDSETGKDFTDTSKLKSIEFDMYNASAEEFNVYFYLIYSDVSSPLQRLSLKANSWTKHVWEIDVSQLSVSVDITAATSFVFKFEPECGDKTIYIDRLKPSYNETAAKEYEINLTDGEICYFEEEYTEFATYSSGYAQCEDILPERRINTDKTYVHDGEKSLRVECPAGYGQYPYVAFSKKLIRSIDFSKYPENSALSFWVYNTQDKAITLTVDLFRKDRPNVRIQFECWYDMKPQQWTNIVIPFAMINVNDGGVDVSTDNLEQFRLVFNAHYDDVPRVYYFDTFKVVYGEEYYSDIYKPIANELYDFDEEGFRAAFEEQPDKFFTANSDVALGISGEEYYEGGYSLKLSGVASGVYNSWGRISFLDVYKYAKYINEQEEYKDNKVLQFKVKAESGFICFGASKDYTACGAIIQFTKVEAGQGWVNVNIPVSAIKEDAIYFNAQNIDVAYIDEIKLVSDVTMSKITWLDDNGGELCVSYVQNGVVPIYPEAQDPQKTSTDGQEYSFAGWSPSLVAAMKDATYKATFISGVNLLNPLIKSYLSEGYVEKDYYMADFVDSLIDVDADGEDYSKPLGVKLSWTDSGHKVYTVYVGEKSNLTGAWQFTTEETEYTVYNLKIGTVYYWKVVADGYTSTTSSFVTLGYSPRLINADGATNVRDIGGWATSADGSTRIKQGLIYRSANLDGISEEGKQTLKVQLGIKTEIDLRNAADIPSGKTEGYGNGFLGAGVNYYICPIGKNLFVDAEISAEAMQHLFDILADSSNYPIIFHCAQGADRTGYIAYLLEKLCGVSTVDLYKDYLLTNFSNQYLGNRRNAGMIWDYEVRINKFQGSTAIEKCKNYLYSNFGIASSTINTIVSMLNVTTEYPSYWGGTLPAEYFNYKIKVYKDGTQIYLDELPDTRVKAYAFMDLTAFAEANVPEGCILDYPRSDLKLRIVSNGTTFIIRYKTYEIKMDGTVYDFEMFESGDNVKDMFDRRDAIITDDKSSDGGNSVSFTLNKNSKTTIIFNEILSRIDSAQGYVDGANYLMLKMRVVATNENETAIVQMCPSHDESYKVFGARIKQTNVNSSDDEWKAVYIPLTDISANVLHVYSNNNCTLYIDEVKLVKIVNPYSGGLENGGNYGE